MLFKDNIVDIRDVIERYEELETEKNFHDDAVAAARDHVAEFLSSQVDGRWEIIAGVHETEATVTAANARALQAKASWELDNIGEFAHLRAILEELKGDSGDEQWRGDWYPPTLIAEHHFTDYAKELLIDCGYFKGDLPPWIHIDWEKTAKEMLVDYTSIDIKGVTYYYWNP